jgi:hypothetical protein
MQLRRRYRRRMLKITGLRSLLVDWVSYHLHFAPMR